MATPAKLDLSSLQVVEAFNGVKDLHPSLQGEAPRDWNPEYLKTTLMWSGLQLEPAQVLIVGAEWLKSVSDHQISTRTVIQGLRLALSLRSMNPGKEEPLLQQPTRVAIPQDGSLAMKELPDIKNFSGISFSTKNPDDQDPINDLPPSMQTLTPDDAGHSRVNPPVADSNEAKTSSYCFLAMYLMKLLVKSAENVAGGLEKMQRRYHSFYGPSGTMKNINIGLGKLITYKDALVSQSMITTSYTVAIAHTHQNIYRQLDQREKGVLSYLCFLPFAYAGMHAYTLMMDIMNESRAPLEKLLSLFYTDITAPALIKIAAMVKDFEVTIETPNRDVTFRYCALLGPEYFAQVRSKSCPHLIFLLACTWKHLSTSTDASDPEKIAAIGVLSTTMKAILRKASGYIGTCLTESMLSGAHASPAFVLALNADVVAAMDDEEEWRNMADDAIEI